MYEYVLEYLSSWWGIAFFVITSIGFGLKMYDVFAKLWPVTTGKHITKGWITWSEFIAPELALLKQALTGAPNQGLISYSYRVQGSQHNGTIPTEKLSQAEVDKYLYKGAAVDVYYSPTLPGFSCARKPPSQSSIGGRIAAKWFLAPVTVLNAVSLFIWYLAKA
jgi:hypothetical protein